MTGPDAGSLAERVRVRAELLLSKYAGRSKWVGYEKPRREAWAEIEQDLRALLAETEAAPSPAQPPAPQGGRVDLAAWLRDWSLAGCEHTIAMDEGRACSPCLRDRILASDWLATHDAEVERAVAERIAAAIEAAAVGKNMTTRVHHAAAARIARAEGA